MCMQCEVYGLPPQTVDIKYFPDRDSALAYAKKKEFEYNTRKLTLALHSVGLLDLNKDLFSFPGA